jgi:hypothetical protein
MARPSPEERKRIAANKAAKARIKAEMDERDARLRERVQAIIDGALIGTDVIIGLPENLQKVVNKLEAAYRLAMQTEQPGHTVQAAMSQAKLLGLIIDQQMVGKPEECIVGPQNLRKLSCRGDR